MNLCIFGTPQRVVEPLHDQGLTPHLVCAAGQEVLDVIHQRVARDAEDLTWRRRVSWVGIEV